MKTTLFITTFMLITNLAVSQGFDLALSFGTGMNNIVERYDNTINIKYSLPFSTTYEIKYVLNDAYFYPNLKFAYINSSISGTNWETNTNIDGEVSSLTTYLLLEHFKENKSINQGYNFGLGYTSENYIENLERGKQSESRKFISVLVSTFLAHKFTDKITAKLEANIIWADPVNTFRGKSKWYIAGEDISFLIYLGIVYHFK